MSLPFPRRDALDGLRALAILAVLLGHAFPATFAYGHLGVDVFFVLSGFLITTLLWTAPTTTIQTIGRFWARRFWRLMPALFVMVVVMLILSWALHSPKETVQAFMTGGAALVGGSANLLPGLGGYFDPEIAINPFLHTWSLGVEAQFYLLFPLILWALRGRPTTAMVVLAICALNSLALSWELYGAQSSAAHYSPLGRAWQPLAGAMLALWMQRKPTTLPAAFGLAAVLALTAIVAFPFTVHPPILALQGVVVLLTLCILASVGDETPAGRALRWPPFVAIGLASYSLYLWHQPVMATLRLFTPDDTLLFGAIAFPLTALLGFASARWIERPGMRVRAGALGTSLAAGLVVLVGFGAFATAVGTNGFESRYAQAPMRSIDQDPHTKAVVACGFPWDPQAEDFTFCTFPAVGSPSPTGTLAIWGDSFGMALTSGFLALDAHPTLLHLGMDGCPFQIEDQWSSLWRACQQRHERALARVLGDDSVTHVAIFARWETPNVRDGAPRLLRAFTTIVERLQEAGKTVVFVESVPGFDRSVGDAALRSWRLGIDTVPTQTRTGHARYPTRIHQEALERAQTLGVPIVPSLDLMCPQEDCPAQLDGVWRYYDEEHLTPLGAKPLAQRVLDSLPPSPRP